MSTTDPPPAPPEPPSSGAAGPRGAVLAALTFVVVAVLAVPIVVAVVQAGRGDGDEGGTALTTPSASPRPSDTPSPTPSRSHRPSRQPSATASPSAKASTAAPPAPRASCWDGVTARRVSRCTEPQGAQGLAWVFSSIKGQRCGAATGSGPDGVVLRQVCRARVSGGRALVVYLQWSSSTTAVAYVQSKGLQPVGGAGSRRVDRFQGSAAGVVKVGAVYADEPFSYIVTLPAGADPATALRQAITARPANQVRGVPAS